MRRDKKFLYIILGAVLIKLLLFAFAEIRAPEAKVKIDTKVYLDTGMMLAKTGAFARPTADWGVSQYELYRTPGYPFFLAVFHGLLKIPIWGIILCQIGLTLLAAFFTYKTAIHIDPRLGFLSALIVLYDPPITIFSMMLLTEALFLFLMSSFMFVFVLYLKQKEIKYLLFSAALLVMATYVRPAGYFLGVAVTLFILYALFQKNIKKGLIHAVLFFVLTYSLIGAWHVRNHYRRHEAIFCSINRASVDMHGLYKHYARAELSEREGMPPIPYYLNITARSLMSLMTGPGTLKNFNSRFLRVAGKVLGYPWMLFWLIGFLVGTVRRPNNFCYRFLLLVVVYFISVSVATTTVMAETRFRISMVPFLAIISAYGWMQIGSWKNILFNKNK